MRSDLQQRGLAYGGKAPEAWLRPDESNSRAFDQMVKSGRDLAARLATRTGWALSLYGRTNWDAVLQK